MTKTQQQTYEEPEVLKDILRRALKGKRFRLECGHRITFHHVFGNDLTIRNGPELTVICAMCGY